MRLADTPDHRTQLRRRARQLDGALATGTFDYAAWFPQSPRLARFTAPAPAGPPAYAPYVRQWLEDLAPRWAPGTAYDRRRIIEGRLVPHFGAALVSAITEEAVEHFLAELLRVTVGAPARRRKLSPRRVNITLQVLRQSLDRAVKRGWLEANPARAVALVRAEKTEVLPLTLAELRQLLDRGLPTPELRRYVTVACFTGLRPSEQLGLQWGDVDWTRRSLSVRRARSRWTRDAVRSDRVKTVASAREVAMLPLVEQTLQAQRAASQLRSAYVFPNRDGGPMDLTNLRERIWRAALQRAGLRHRALYQTRHTFATLMLQAGEDIGWVATMLGHTSIEMVIRHYHRFIPNLTRRDGTAMTKQLEESGW